MRGPHAAVGMIFQEESTFPWRTVIDNVAFPLEMAGMPKAERLAKGKPTAVYCDSGYRASLGASLLRAAGFENVRNVPGSWKAWTAAGLPVEKPKEDKKASDTDR